MKFKVLWDILPCSQILHCRGFRQDHYSETALSEGRYSEGYLYFNLRLALPSDLFLSVFPTKFCRKQSPTLTCVYFVHELHFDVLPSFLLFEICHIFKERISYYERLFLSFFSSRIEVLEMERYVPVYHTGTSFRSRISYRHL
jgi:hypothetical protein